MKFLKVMLAVLTCLAVTLTGVLLFVDKHGPRYIQIDNSEDCASHFCNAVIPQPARCAARAGGCLAFTACAAC